MSHLDALLRQFQLPDPGNEGDVLSIVSGIPSWKVIEAGSPGTSIPAVVVLSPGLTPASNTSAIQGAIDSLTASGGEVWLMPGVWDLARSLAEDLVRVNSAGTWSSTEANTCACLVMRSNVVLRGIGNVRLQSSSDAGSVFVVAFCEASSAGLDNLNIYPYPTSGFSGSVLMSDWGHNTGIKITNCLFSGGTDSAIRAGQSGVKRLTIADCYFSSSDVPAIIVGYDTSVQNEGIKINRCHFLGRDAAWISGSNISVTDCEIFTVDANAIQIGSSLQDSNNILISGLRISPGGYSTVGVKIVNNVNNVKISDIYQFGGRNLLQIQPGTGKTVHSILVSGCSGNSTANAAFDEVAASGTVHSIQYTGNRAANSGQACNLRGTSGIISSCSSYGCGTSGNTAVDTLTAAQNWV